MAPFSKPISFGADLLHDLERALDLEWLETNGIGGFASSTIIQAHTRRYHGLLIAAFDPPVARHNMLTALDVAVNHDGRDHFLSTHLYPDTVFPEGHLTLERFELAPHPRWTHRLEGGLTVIHELWMVPGRNTTVMRWSLPAGSPTAQMDVIPLVALRDFHTLTLAAPEAPAFLDIDETRMTLRPQAPLVEPLHIHHTASQVETDERWYRQFQLPVESTREEHDAEDLWNPGAIVFDLEPGKPAIIIASTDDESIRDPLAYAEETLEMRREDERPVHISVPGDVAIERLAPAVRAFRVVRSDGMASVMAGYHWFADWGRDTMIALPGLYLVHGHIDEAMATLRTWMSYLDRGMLPNRFPDLGEPPEYNTVDAALWFSVAVLRTWQCLGGRGPRGLAVTEDPWGEPETPNLSELGHDEAAFLREAMVAIEDIIHNHTIGTRHGIRVEEDGLVTQGEGKMQLTWMDAKWKDKVYTPRHGKPIEIQALWHSTLRTAALLRHAFGEPTRALQLEKRALEVKSAVEAGFWSEGKPGLADVIGPNGKADRSIRPNQIFAVSLPFPVVGPEIAESVLATIDEHLITPWGLRSLAPSDPNYHGIYEGPRRVRDAAYHQGTIWSWLIGPYVDAALRVRGRSRKLADCLRRSLNSLTEHVETQAGLGSVSENFDGDLPHRPRACIAQAWSVAELLRALWILSLI